MSKPSQEVELKLAIVNKAELISLLITLGANFIAKVQQDDYLYNSSYFNFAQTDEALRLRKEKHSDSERIYITYKGTPTFSNQGHKIRDEFELTIDDFETMDKILTSLRFTNFALVKKIRSIYNLNEISITIDELPFGTFIELEGDPEKSEDIRKKLGLTNTEPIKKGYVSLQLEWEAKHSDE